MNREEILARSRSENNDEGLREAENQGRKLGIAIFFVVQFCLVLFNAYNDQPWDALLAMGWLFVAAECYPKYKFTRKKSFLLLTIVFVLGTIYFLYRHIASVLG